MRRKPIMVIALALVGVLVVAIVGLLLYGRSKVQPDGRLLLEGSAPVTAPAERAFDRILSSDGLKAWWLGTLGKVEASPRWPEPGETLTFEMNGQPVRYRAERLERPRLLVAIGEYPSGKSTLTHEFVADGAGLTYKKTVLIEPNPGTGALGRWMLGAIVGISVPREVSRAAAYAARE